MSATPLIVHGNTSSLDDSSDTTQLSVLTSAQILSTYGLTVPDGNYAKVDISNHTTSDGNYYYQFVNFDQYLNGIPYDQIEQSDVYAVNSGDFEPTFRYMPKQPIQTLISKELNISETGIVSLHIFVPCDDIDITLPDIICIGSNIGDPMSDETASTFSFGETTSIVGGSDRISKSRLESFYGITNYTGWSDNALSQPDSAWDIFAKYEFAVNGGILISEDTNYYIRVCLLDDITTPAQLGQQIDWDSVRALPMITITPQDIANASIVP